MNRHLVFRCAICRATTSLRAEWSDQRAAEVACASCHALYQLDAGRDRADSDQAYLEQVRQYAVTNRIDLASAYSVVEGIIPREKIRTLPPGSAELPRAGTSAARSLALLALLILSLGALARQLRPIPALGRGPGGATTEALVPGADPVKLVAVTYRLDGEGRLTQVVASDPRSALLAFCQHESNVENMQAVSIAPDLVAGLGGRTGVVRVSEQPGSFAWVAIRRDGSSGRWTIGDGASPVAIDRGRKMPPSAELLTF